MNYLYKNYLIYIFYLNIFHKKIIKYIIWGLGIGDWGLGIGDWAQSPIPNPQSPIPNPQKKTIFLVYKYKKINNIKVLILLYV